MAKAEKQLTRKEKQKALGTFRISRIFLPILLGLAVVSYLFYKQYDPIAFARINWSLVTVFWLCMALLFLVARILFYAARLYLLADGSFTFLRCIQLIFLWEFSSAVSPTNVGGSAVALFIISQERIGAAKTTTIVIYTIVLDALFFLLLIPFWVLIFGSNIMGPGQVPVDQFGGWEITLLIAYSIMLLYGLFFAYGLFYRPESLRRFSVWLSKRALLRRFSRQLVRLGEDITITSKALYQQRFSYHLSAFLTTAGAWSSRFFLIICLIIGIPQSLNIELASIFELYARIQTMFIMMAVSPTPGGAGFAEILFGGLLSDYVPGGIAVLVSFIWRAMAYYFFLLAGAIIIPQWLNRILRSRKQRKAKRQ